MTRRAARIYDTPGYLLHATAWRETSLVIQAFSRDHGIMTLVAKGAKRPHSQLRPVLSAFQPLLLSWTGVRDVKTLTRAEANGLTPLRGRAFMSAWYMNELILRLLAREDPHPVVFDAYQLALQDLSISANPDTQGALPLTTILRRFEWTLLQEAGYGLDLPAPDFNNPQEVREIRAPLRDRLDQLLERPLLTRRVLLDLYGS